MTQPNPKIEETPIVNAGCFYQEWNCRRMNKNGDCFDANEARKLELRLSIANAKVRELETRVGICVDALKRINKLRVEYDKDGNEMHRAISSDVLANQGMLSMGFKMREDAELLAIREVSGEMEEAGIRARDLIHSSLCGHQDCRVECTELTFTLKRANELKMKE